MRRTIWKIGQLGRLLLNDSFEVEVSEVSEDLLVTLLFMMMRWQESRKLWLTARVK